MARTLKEYANQMYKACSQVTRIIEKRRKETGKGPTRNEVKEVAIEACKQHRVTYRQMNRIMQFD